MQQRLNGLLAVIRQLVPAATVELYAPRCSWKAQGPSLSRTERLQIEWLAAQVLATGKVICIDDEKDLPNSQQLSGLPDSDQAQVPLQFLAGFPLGKTSSSSDVLIVMARTRYRLTLEQQRAIAILAAEMGRLLDPVSETVVPSQLDLAPADIVSERREGEGQTVLTSADYRSVIRLSVALQSCLTFQDLTSQLLALMPANLPIHAFEVVITLENQKSQQLCFWSDDAVSIPKDDELACQIPEPFDITMMDAAFSPLLPQRPALTGNGKASLPINSRLWRCYQLTSQHLTLGTLKFELKAEAAEHLPVENSILNCVADQISVTLRRLVLLRQLQTENLQDPLTKLFNRRHMMMVLSKLLKRVSYGRYQVGLIMMDLDHFKQINDTYGHDAGDQVLSMVGLFLKGHARPNDVVCRFGGEEFVLILPGVTWDILSRRAHQLCRSLHYMNLNLAETPLQITISAGFAIAPAHAKTPATLIKAADTALYEAKCQGRDRAVGAPPPSETGT